MRKVILMLIVAISAVACCTPCSKSAPKIGDLENGAWKLIEFQNKPIEDSPITLTFDAKEKMVYGTAACNNFFGGYTLSEKKENNIEIKNIGATRKLCPDTEIEDAFTAQLGNTVRVKLEGENLVLINAQGDMIALLTKVNL